jgi:predicted RNase H-like HicB family nuclease
MTLTEDSYTYWREQWDSLVEVVRRPMLNTYTIHLIIEEVSGETRYSAAVKEMPGCFTESRDLQLLFENLYDAMSAGLAAQQEGKDNEQMDTQKEQKRNIFEADYPNLEDG